MQTIRLLLLLLHLIGFAAMAGGFLYQLRMRTTEVSAMVIGMAIFQFVTGALLIWTRRSLDLPVIDAKVGVKAAIDLVIVALAITSLRVRRSWLFYSIGVLAIAEAAVAVLWT